MEIKCCSDKEIHNSQHVLDKEGALLVALSKVEQYRAECDFFQKKYGMTMEDFESHLHGERGSENFEKENDMDDWEFSLEALKWWEKRIKEIRGVIV